MKLKMSLAFALAMGAGPALAQGADFYAGKTITMYVGLSAGGGYDQNARLVARHLDKYIAGKPTIVVRNMPGAGHLVGTNAIYASKPDGLTIGSFNTGLIYNQLINADGVRFDLSKMSWVGKAASESRIVAVAAQSPIKTWQDLVSLKDPVNFAVAGPGSASYVETVMLANVLKLPVRIQTGYNGTDDQLAMRRGEIVGSIASRSSYDQFVKNGFGRLIAQIGGTVDPAFGFDLVLLGFVAAVLGGMGSSMGALAGGLLVGILSKLVGGYVSTAAEHGIAFALLMLALALRPQGLFGRPEVSKA
jgi:tripartite-type tricarboxylate transporter receptor subunit TctC